MEAIFLAINERVIRPSQSLGLSHRIQTANDFMGFISRANAGTTKGPHSREPAVCGGNHIQLPVCAPLGLPPAPLLPSNTGACGASNVLK